MGTETRDGGRTTTVLLCGDVMLGRGVDQILRHPGDPALVEQSVRDARGYVHLAEVASGAIPRPVADGWPWGEALAEVAHARPAVLVVNVETSITRAAEFALGKAVHYRMSPANLPCLLAVGPDVCVLANNHVLDFGRSGLEETLRVTCTFLGHLLEVRAHQLVALVVIAVGRSPLNHHIASLNVARVR